MYRKYRWRSECGFGWWFSFLPSFKWWWRLPTRRALLRQLKEYLECLKRKQKRIKEEIEDVEKEIEDLEKETGR